MSERGVFVGITNRKDVPFHPGKISRGHLVMAAVAPHANATASMQRIMAMNAADYNGFQLCIADGSDAYIVRGDGKTMELVTLGDERITILTESGFTPKHSPRAAAALHILQGYERGYPPHVMTAVRTLDSVLSYRERSNEEASVAVDGSDGNYGTRSSTIIRLDPALSLFDIWHREGPPRGQGFFDAHRMAITKL